MCVALPPRLVVLHGPPAAGKLTLARELATLSGARLFHNHLTVDLLLALFPFGSRPFIAHRERIWLDCLRDAAAFGGDILFTFSPEATVAPDLPVRLQTTFEQAGGTVVWIAIDCAEAEVERRIESDSRRAFGKLASLATYRQLRAAGAFAYPPLPAYFRIDSTILPPAAAARQVQAFLAGPANDTGTID